VVCPWQVLGAYSLKHQKTPLCKIEQKLRSNLVNSRIDFREFYSFQGVNSQEFPRVMATVDFSCFEIAREKLKKKRWQAQVAKK